MQWIDVALRMHARLVFSQLGLQLMLIEWIAHAHKFQDLRRFHQRQLQHRGLALGDSSTTALVAGAAGRALLEVKAFANGELACATAHKRNTTAKRARTCHAISKHVKQKRSCFGRDQGQACPSLPRHRRRARQHHNINLRRNPPLSESDRGKFSPQIDFMFFVAHAVDVAASQARSPVRPVPARPRPPAPARARSPPARPPVAARRPRAPRPFARARPRPPAPVRRQLARPRPLAARRPRPLAARQPVIRSPAGSLGPGRLGTSAGTMLCMS